MTKAQKQERDEAIAKLREWIKPGDTVYTILRNVSRSGMQREIGIVLMKPDGVVLHPNWSVAKALGYRLGKRDGVIVGGCGMDMGFEIVYNLSRVLFGAGFGCIGKECHSNDHFNGDRDYTENKFRVTCLDDSGARVPATKLVWEHRDDAEKYAKSVAVTREALVEGTHWHRDASGWDNDGGYALEHRWL